MKSTSQLALKHRIAKRYANALFELSYQTKNLDQNHLDLQMIAAMIDQSENFNAFLQNPEIPSPMRQAALNALFKDRISPLTLKFLYFLVHHDRLNLLSEIGAAFDELYCENKNIFKIKITSARQLTANQAAAIGDRLKSRLNKNIDRDLEIDPGLIGGFKIQVGDQIHDFSIQTQLEKFKNRILSS